MANPLRLPMIPRALGNLIHPPATRRYPFEVRPRFSGARGSIEFDLASCNFCMLCARRCPAAAITVDREARTWAIEQLTCIACGVCVDVCNKKSLTMSIDSRRVHTRAEVGPQGQRPGHEAWQGALPED
jgi:formate hydrogenlyase subunit 6/NADH:ubiquinone oxidoreductase subunit I